MSITELGALGEFIGSIAVLFLSVEIHRRLTLGLLIRFVEASVRFQRLLAIKQSVYLALSFPGVIAVVFGPPHPGKAALRQTILKYVTKFR